jgi:NADP-dependent 3-hydroxy acid dehydrogenase YdfG
VTAVLAGRDAVVTGASRGIGLAIARALARAGARVALIARSAQTLTARAAELGGNALPVVCDLTDPAAVTRAAQGITDAFGHPPDILVNNAGTFGPRPIQAITPELFAETVRVNLIAPFLLVHAFLPAMRARGHGHIVTIGSIADRIAYPENGAYAASKFGLRGLHEVMRTELRGTGIRTTLVSPGPTETDIWASVQESGMRRFPTRTEMLHPEAVADAVLYAVTQPEAVNIDELRLSRA